MELGQERVSKKASKKRRVSGDRVARDSAAEEEHGDTSLGLDTEGVGPK